MRERKSEEELRGGEEVNGKQKASGRARMQTYS